jgi:hypothetical protein
LPWLETVSNTIVSSASDTIPWAAEGVVMVRSSLRDEMVWRDGRPWVETHGDLPRSLCDQ